MDTPNITINLDKICRSCLSEEGEMTSLFDTINADDVKITEMLESCALLQAEEGDGLPSQICLQCYSIIHQAYEFKLQCQKSESIIRSCLSDMKHIQIVKIEDDQINENDEVYMENVTIIEEVDEKLTVNYEIENTVECKSDFDTHDEMYDHNFDNLKEFCCPKCLKKFKQEHILHVHMRHCKIHDCHICKKKFRTVGYLQNHLKKKHDPGYIPDGKKFKCTECDKAYTSPANLTIHQYSHTGIKPYKCEYCDRGFTKMISLNSHVALHTGKRKHLCTECGRGFTTTTNLNQHKKIHTGERPFKCSHCSSSFTASGDLKIHLRCHTGEKPYLCPTCGRSFARISHLNTHIRTHTGERPFVCSVCGRGFAQSGDLRSHQRTHTGEKPYACTVCSKRFAQSSGLASHMATHSGIKAHVCKICNRAFSQASSLMRHVKAHS